MRCTKPTRSCIQVWFALELVLELLGVKFWVDNCFKICMFFIRLFDKQFCKFKWRCATDNYRIFVCACTKLARNQFMLSLVLEHVCVPQDYFTDTCAVVGGTGSYLICAHAFSSFQVKLNDPTSHSMSFQLPCNFPRSPIHLAFFPGR